MSNLRALLDTVCDRLAPDPVAALLPDPSQPRWLRSTLQARGAAAHLTEALGELSDDVEELEELAGLLKDEGETQRGNRAASIARDVAAQLALVTEVRDALLDLEASR